MSEVSDAELGLTIVHGSSKSTKQIMTSGSNWALFIQQFANHKGCHFKLKMKYRYRCFKWSEAKDALPFSGNHIGSPDCVN